MNTTVQEETPTLVLGFCLLLIALALLGIGRALRKVEDAMSDYTVKLEEIAANLTEASDEVVTELVSLRERLEAKDALDEGDKALLDSIAAKAQSLADIIPDAPVVEPTPEVVPEAPVEVPVEVPVEPTA